MNSSFSQHLDLTGVGDRDKGLSFSAGPASSFAASAINVSGEDLAPLGDISLLLYLFAFHTQC
jgi:hypothetical protein